MPGITPLRLVVFWGLTFWLTLVGCGGRLVVRPADRAGPSALSAYESTGGVWLARHALLVNRPFDFGLALGVESIGAALAAGRRLEENQKLAASLEGKPALFEAASIAEATRLRCGRRVVGRAWALLWIAEKPDVRVVVEGASRPHTVTAPVPADPASDAGWQALRQVARRAVGELAAVVCGERPPTAPKLRE